MVPSTNTMLNVDFTLPIYKWKMNIGTYLEAVAFVTSYAHCEM